MSNGADHNWSNPETRAVAYYLFEFEREALETIADIESFYDFLSKEDQERFLEDTRSSMLSGMVPGLPWEGTLEEWLEIFFPGARIKYSAGILKELFGNQSLGSTPTLWEAGILIGASLRYQEGERGASINESDPIWEEELSKRDFGLLVELFLLALDRVDWEEIVTVWLESQEDSEEPGNEGD